MARLLDLGQFESLEDAVAKVQPGDRYLRIGSMILPVEGSLPLTLPAMFWFSMLTRVGGLHGAIAREIKESNPHAAFPLIRALAEAVLMVVYVNDHPKYARALVDRPQELAAKGIKRKSIQSLISYAQDHAPGMKDVYQDLSEATHFGSLAMWASASTTGDMSFSWSSAPAWRHEEQGLVACAQTLELASAVTYYLREFAIRHVIPLKGTHPGPE